MNDYLEHYGVQGMRWGVRNYQNEDGSLTNRGRDHYGIGSKIKSQYATERYYNEKRDAAQRKLIEARKSARAAYKLEKAGASRVDRLKAREKFKEKKSKASNKYDKELENINYKWTKDSTYGGLAGLGLGTAAVGALLKGAGTGAIVNGHQYAGLFLSEVGNYAIGYGLTEAIAMPAIKYLNERYFNEKDSK